MPGFTFYDALSKLTSQNSFKMDYCHPRIGLYYIGAERFMTLPWFE